MSQDKIIDNNEYDCFNINNSKEMKQPYLSKSTEKNYNVYKGKNDFEYLNTYMENLLPNTEFSSEYPYNRITDYSRDKVSNMNILKTPSSREESTHNHISLLEETNEIRKPQNSINLSIKNKKNYFSPDKTYQIIHPKNSLTEKKSKKYIYPENRVNNTENLLPYAFQNFINNRKYNIQNNSVNSNYTKIERQPKKDNNIYLYRNEDENREYKNYNNKPIYNFNCNTPYIEKTNYNYNSSKVNPLYERMRLNKIKNNNFRNNYNQYNNNYYSPFSRKMIRDNNRIKIVYNQGNGINTSESEEYNNISRYGNETSDNNYNSKNMFY